MSIVPTPANENIQTTISKSIVPDLEWFDRTKQNLKTSREKLDYSLRVTVS